MFEIPKARDIVDKSIAADIDPKLLILNFKAPKVQRQI